MIKVGFVELKGEIRCLKWNVLEYMAEQDFDSFIAMCGPYGVLPGGGGRIRDPKTDFSLGQR